MYVKFIKNTNERVHTMSTELKYSSRATAIRGAARKGIDTQFVKQNDAGEWVIEMPEFEQGEIVADQLIAENMGDFDEADAELVQRIAENETPPVATDETPVPETIVVVTQGVPYKVLARQSPPKSLLVKPVAYIFEFLDMNPEMPRKDAITYFVNQGINIHTAKTQFQRHRMFAAEKQSKGE